MRNLENISLPLTPRRSPLTQVHGYSLVELLVAMLAGVVVLLATIQSFDHFQQRFVRQQTRMARHQDLRIGLAVMGSELRLAGTGGRPGGPPLLTAGPKEVAFRANVGGYTTTLTADVLATQLDLPVGNGSGWPKGKRVLVCEVDRCAEGRLAGTGRTGALSLVEPLAQAFGAHSQVCVVNEIRYYLGVDAQGRHRLMREVDGGASALVGNVARFELAYLGKDDQPTNDPAQVTRVLIQLAVEGSRRIIRSEVGLRV